MFECDAAIMCIMQIRVNESIMRCMRHQMKSFCVLKWMVLCLNVNYAGVFQLELHITLLNKKETSLNVFYDHETTNNF